MGNRWGKPNKKRQHEDWHDVQLEPEKKHQKRDRNEVDGAKVEIDSVNMDADTAETKTISNICNEMVDRSFGFLDVESLLNVAGTCKRLQIAAINKFSNDHGNKTVWLYLFESKYDALNVYPNHNSIDVIGLKFCYPFVRCFGSILSTLKINYNNNVDKRSAYLDRYVSQYCADTMTSIFFGCKQTFSIENFPKSFKSVTKVQFNTVNLADQLPNIVKLFPNLRHLDMQFITIDDDIDTAVHFPHLEHLTIGIRIPIHYSINRFANRFTNRNGAKLLQANSQLKSLEIRTMPGISLNELLDMISENKSISKLTIDTMRDSFRVKDVNAVELNQFVREHPLIERLDFHDYRFTGDEAIMFIYQLNALEQFKFEVKDQIERNLLLGQLDESWQTNISTANANLITIIRNKI